MENHISPKLEQIEKIVPYRSGAAIEEIQKYADIERVLKLGSNENPFGASPLAQKAVAAISANSIAGYPNDSAKTLYKELSAYTGKPSDHIILGSGSSEILEMCTQLFLSPEQNLIVFEHTFSLFKNLGYASGAQVKLVAEKNLIQSLDNMLTHIDSDTGLIIFANPDNPTGNLFSLESLITFLEKIPKHVKVVIDEAYHEFIEDGAYSSAINLVDQFKNLVVTRTFSKCFGLAGLRIGYGVTNATLASYLQRMRMPFNVNTLGIIAATETLKDTSYITKTLENNSKEKRKFKRFFQNNAIPIIADHANFLTINLGKYAIPVFNDLKQKGIIVFSLESYGLPHLIRITIGTPDDNEYFFELFGRILVLAHNN